MLISERLLRSAMASKLAYAKDVKSLPLFPLSKQLNNLSEKVKIVDCQKTGAHAYIWETGSNSRVISFRGSRDIKDVVKYLNTRQVPFNFCEHRVRVHNVIHDMFENIEPYLLDVLFDEGFSKKQNITFCGHSLGGCLAMYASAYIGHMTNHNHNIVCHTFGSPKTGDAKFVEWYNEAITESVHLKNKYDLVPLLPLIGYADLERTTLDMTSRHILDDHDLEVYIEHIRNTIQLQK